MLYPVFVQCLLSAVDHPLVSAQRMTRHQFRYVLVIFHNQKASKSRDWTPPALRSAPAMLRKGSQMISVCFAGQISWSSRIWEIFHVTCIHPSIASICSKHFQTQFTYYSHAISRYFSRYWTPAHQNSESICVTTLLSLIRQLVQR